MIKRYLRPDTFFILVLTLVLLALIIGRNGSAHLPETAAQPRQANPLSVSSDGSQTTTNVSGADLQAATPPVASTTNARLSPQQAVPYQAQ